MPAARLAWHALKQVPLPLIAASVTGWTALAAMQAFPELPVLCISPSAGRDVAARLSAAFAAVQPDAVLIASAVMILAMMPVLLATPVSHVWYRSLTRRRTRAVALFLLGYALAWLGALLLLVAASLLIGSLALLPAPAFAAMIAFAWQASPLKQVCLNRCHRRLPLAAFGWRAETDALRYGASHGGWCVGACWALMLLPLAANGALHLILMMAVTLISLTERAHVPRTRRWGAALPAWPGMRLPRRQYDQGSVHG